MPQWPDVSGGCARPSESPTVAAVCWPSRAGTDPAPAPWSVLELLSRTSVSNESRSAQHPVLGVQERERGSDGKRPTPTLLVGRPGGCAVGCGGSALCCTVIPPRHPDARCHGHGPERERARKAVARQGKGREGKGRGWAWTWTCLTTAPTALHVWPLRLGRTVCAQLCDK